MILRFRNFALFALLAFASVVAWPVHAYNGSDDFEDCVTLTIKGNGTTALTNFPLLVRVSEAELPGFMYTRASPDQLAFVDASGNRLSYDVDDWSATGESIIWVKIPTLPDKGTTVTFWWKLKEGQTAPSNDEADVWSDYAGVWHMNDVTDSTTNKMSGTIGSTSSIDSEGAFGHAIRSSGDGEPLLLADASYDVNSLTNGTFTITFWTYLNSVSDGSTSSQYLFSRRETWNDDGYALYLHPRTPGDSANIGIAGGDSGYKYTTTGPVKGLIRDGWMQNDIVYSKEDTKFYWYINGILDSTHGYSRNLESYSSYPFANGAQNKIAIGGRLVSGSGANSNVNGAIDEFRMRAGATDAVRAGAEYANTTQRSYIGATDDDFIKTGFVTTNNVEMDYWKTSPDISVKSWVYGNLDESLVTIDGGTLYTSAGSGIATGVPYKCAYHIGNWYTNEVNASVFASLVPGKYKVHFRREAAKGYDSAEDAIVWIEVVESVDELYADHVDLKVRGGGVDLTNFPMLVRISEDQLPGFKYSRAASNELAFVMSGSVKSLPYEVDTWDESGESLVWVKLPTLPANGTTVTMYWSPKEGRTPLSYAPQGVWSGYAGVWHMGDATDSSEGKADGSLGAASPAQGFMGKALHNSSNDGGPFITVTPNDSIDSLTNNGFVASMWVNLDSASTGGAFLFGRRSRIYSTTGYAVAFYEDAPSPVAMFPGGSANKNQNYRHNPKGLAAGEWARLDFVFAKGRYQCWLNGEVATKSSAPTIPLPSNGDGLPFVIGGAVGNTTALAVAGAIDEFRLVPYDAASYAARIAAEYANMAQTDYTSATNGSFILPGMVVSDGKIYDYWSTPLEISTNTWVVGSITSNDVSVLSEAALRSGGGVRYYWQDVLKPDVQNAIASTKKIPEVLAELPEGHYKLCVASVSDAYVVDPFEIDIVVRVDTSLYTDWVQFTLNGIPEDVEITNYTLLVRVSEEILPGFKYARAGNGTRLAFMDDNGAKLYYDADTWNPTGESIVWVNVPVARKGTVVTFYWGIDASKASPSNDSKKVWENYAGVWHMNKYRTNQTADSTGNAEPGTVHENAVYSSDGIFGNAYGRTVSGAHGPIVTIPANDAIDSLTGGVFTVSGWIRMNSLSNYWANIVSRSEKDATDAWRVRFYGDNTDNVEIQANANSYTSFSTVGKFTEKEWIPFAVVYKGTSVAMYLNGDLIYEKTGMTAPKNADGWDFYIGGMASDDPSSTYVPKFPSGTTSTLNGDMDEVRLMYGAMDADRISVECANAKLLDYRGTTDESFLKAGLVMVDGVATDYWWPEPSLSATMWEQGRAPESLTYNNGSLYSGGAVTNWCENITTGDVALEFIADADDLRDLPVGAYRIVNRGVAVEDIVLEFTVTENTGFDTIGGTASGRILLMNNDWSQTNAVIRGQGWANTNATYGATTYTYWEHCKTNETATYNAKSSYESILWSVDGASTNKLWHLVNCRHGNTFPDDENLKQNQNYLPYNAASSGSIDVETIGFGTDIIGVGQLLMRNVEGAAVYSPCYTNGIGTIYFDAVNGWTNVSATLIVEVARDTPDNDSSTIGGTSEQDSSTAQDDLYDGTNVTSKASVDYSALYQQLDWQVCTGNVVRVSSLSGEATLTPAGEVGAIELDVENGGTMNEFYRIYIPLDIRESVRFRIRRDSRDDSQKEDGDAYVLLDNILVSEPKVVAGLENMGWYDSTKEGKEILGYEGAFDPLLPAVGDVVHGKAKPLCDTNYFGSAKMHYRWRYLNHAFEDWRVVEMKPTDGCFVTQDALELPDSVGDVEFWYESVLQAPYYTYFDYSGADLAEAMAAIYSEKVSVVTNAAAVSAKYPSSGTDWFVRLREGHSDNSYESMRLITETPSGSGCETNAMALVAEGKWRGYLKTPNAVEGGLNFRFEAVKLLSVDDGVPSYTSVGWSATTPMTNALPATALAAFDEEGGDKVWSSVLCDSKTGYLVFSYDEASGAISACRGDYQDFNLWSTAANDLFVGSAIETNRSNYAAQEIEADISTWTVSVATNANWREDFSVGEGQPAAEVYQRDSPFAETNLTSGWTAKYASWTYQQWECDQGKYGSGTALQLEGKGRGEFRYTGGSDMPDGIDTVNFTARLAQFNEFDNFAYYGMGSWNGFRVVNAWESTNYTFVTYAALTLDNENNGYDGAGTASLVAYYHPQYGAYEVRVARGGSNGTKLRCSLYKWSKSGTGDGDEITCKLLGTRDFDQVSVTGLHREYGNIGLMPAFYISVQEYTTDKGKPGTLVYAGMTHEPVSTSVSPTPSNLKNTQFSTCVYFDTEDDRLTQGTFGVLSRNCWGAFLKPVRFDRPVAMVGGHEAGWNVTSFTDKLNYFSAGTVAWPDGWPSEWSVSASPTGYGSYSDYYNYCWILPPGRTLKYDSNTHWGFTGVTNVSQEIAVEIATPGSNNWHSVTNVTVTGFMNQNVSCAVRKRDKYDVRLRVLGENRSRLDVTVDDVELTQWNGKWTEGYDTRNNNGFPQKFVYTSAWIAQDDDELATKVVRLQPARAKNEDTPVSLRSPVMEGVGAFHVRWRNADSNAVFWVQRYMDNADNVQSGLIRETENGAAAYGSAWENVGSLDFTDPASDVYGKVSGGKTFFFSNRYDNISNTVLRVVAATNVIDHVLSGDVSLEYPDYGTIEIVESYAWTLPPYDDRSWSGWNFRADGWAATGDPSLWASLGDATHGMSGLLNNTVDDASSLADEPPECYSGNKPYIQSPTFNTNCIGSVEFRARLYDPIFDVAAGQPAVVSVYGATTGSIDKETGEPTAWELVTNIIVTSSVYELKTAKFQTDQQYCAMRFAIDGVKGVIGDASTPLYSPPLRVAIDDICVIEQPVPSVRFKLDFVRPFRNAEALKNTALVADIAASAEQPIIGEPFGFQAELEISDLENEIVMDDPTRPVRVYLSYYPYAKPWGWNNWKAATGAVTDIELTPVDGEKFVSRSTLSLPGSVCPAQKVGADSSLPNTAKYRLVQYHVYVTYYDTYGDFHTHNLTPDEWRLPEWNDGFVSDPNKKPGASFSAYTLLETLAPKQAWINEVNFVEGNRARSETNQWIEVAIPSNEDMTGWSINYRDRLDNKGTLFMFGRNSTYGVNDATTVNGTTNGYAFYISKGCYTQLEGANATWYEEVGALNFIEPYGFELVRPTGIVEHRVVIEGYNMYDPATRPEYAKAYSGTNLVEYLKRTVGGDWVWGDKDWHSMTNFTVGVTNGIGAVHEDWYSPMASTPGHLNYGQIIDPNTRIRPNGDYVWITSKLLTENISQDFGGNTGREITMSLDAGVTTNIVFDVDKWYMLDWSATPNERTSIAGPEVMTNITDTGTKVFGRYTLTMASISNNIDVAASAVPSDEVTAFLPTNGDAKVTADAYTPAIMKWLAAGVTGDGTPFSGSTLTNALYREWGDTASAKVIDLVGMYWLDLDPTKAGWELWGGSVLAMPTNRPYTFNGVQYVRTNLITKVRLMITNTVDSSVAPYPPYRLQGLNNEKSDEYTGDKWSSETFKVLMTFDKTYSIWNAMRYFIFDKNSFYPANATDGDPFSATIEVADPNLEGYIWAGDSVGSKWALDTERTPVGVSVLKKEDILPRKNE